MLPICGVPTPGEVEAAGRGARVEEKRKAPAVRPVRPRARTTGTLLRGQESAEGERRSPTRKSVSGVGERIILLGFL